MSQWPGGGAAGWRRSGPARPGTLSHHAAACHRRRCHREFRAAPQPGDLRGRAPWPPTSDRLIHSSVTASGAPGLDSGTVGSPGVLSLVPRRPHGPALNGHCRDSPEARTPRLREPLPVSRGPSGPSSAAAGDPTVTVGPCDPIRSGSDSGTAPPGGRQQCQLEQCQLHCQLLLKVKLKPTMPT